MKQGLDQHFCTSDDHPRIGWTSPLVLLCADCIVFFVGERLGHPAITRTVTTRNTRVSARRHSARVPSPGRLAASHELYVPWTDHTTKAASMSFRLKTIPIVFASSAIELVAPPSTHPLSELVKTIGIVLRRNDIDAAFVVWSVHLKTIPIVFASSAIGSVLGGAT